MTPFDVDALRKMAADLAYKIPTEDADDIEAAAAEIERLEKGWLNMSVEAARLVAKCDLLCLDRDAYKKTAEDAHWQIQGMSRKLNTLEATREEAREFHSAEVATLRTGHERAKRALRIALAELEASGR